MRPESLGTYSQRPITVGCTAAEVSSGKPHAHFRCSFGTSAAVSPATSAETLRLFVIPLPQPFQSGSLRSRAGRTNLQMLIGSRAGGAGRVGGRAGAPAAPPAALLSSAEPPERKDAAASRS